MFLQRLGLWTYSIFVLCQLVETKFTHKWLPVYYSTNCGSLKGGHSRIFRLDMLWIWQSLVIDKSKPDKTYRHTNKFIPRQGFLIK